jgi:hypothetical protein
MPADERDPHCKGQLGRQTGEALGFVALARFFFLIGVIGVLRNSDTAEMDTREGGLGGRSMQCAKTGQSLGGKRPTAARTSPDDHEGADA